jgi:hypothetical protein
MIPGYAVRRKVVVRGRNREGRVADRMRARVRERGHHTVRAF